MLEAVHVLGTWPLSAAITGVLVFALHGLLRWRGGRFAGLVAAAPLTSLPTLLCLGAAHGSGYAADAAVAGLHLNGFIALGLVVWMHLRRGAEPLDGDDDRTHDDDVRGDRPRIARRACTGTTSTTATTATTAMTHHAHARQALGHAVGAAAVTGSSLALAAGLPAATCGLIAALPWTGACMAVCAFRLSGRAGMAAFLDGYARGMPSRLAFFGLTALTAAPLGTPAALALGVVAGALVLRLQRDLAALGASAAASPAAR